MERELANTLVILLWWGGVAMVSGRTRVLSFMLSRGIHCVIERFGFSSGGWACFVGVFVVWMCG